MEYYNNCVSLGWFCGTASSLAILGLRNFSGPFDWYFSDFDSVIRQIDDEFIDFMRKENLEVIDDKPKEFRDKKYDFYFMHDVKENFDNEYDNIYAKYTKRAKRFIETIKSPTCFFRAVRSETEIEYIINNSEYIESILKRYNTKNIIIYILLDGMSSLPNNLMQFSLILKQYSGNKYEMRNMFNHSIELLKFCNTLLSPEKINLNKEFVHQNIYKNLLLLKKRGFLQKLHHP